MQRLGARAGELRSLVASLLAASPFCRAEACARQDFEEDNTGFLGRWLGPRAGELGSLMASLLAVPLSAERKVRHRMCEQGNSRQWLGCHSLLYRCWHMRIIQHT
jgi:hypothetical protein